MTDVILIVDQDLIFREITQSYFKSDPDFTAKSLRQMVKVFGHKSKNISIVSADDHKGIKAYTQAGYSIFVENGNRANLVLDLIGNIVNEVNIAPPKYLILVTSDAIFYTLLREIRNEYTVVSLWIPTSEIPRFFRRLYVDDCRLLNDILPYNKDEDIHDSIDQAIIDNLEVDHEIEHLQKILKILHKNRRQLEEQAAKYSSLRVPTDLFNELEETRVKISKNEEKLLKLQARRKNKK